MHQYVECLQEQERGWCCPGEHCGICGLQPSGKPGNVRQEGCRWDLAAEALAVEVNA